MKIGKLSWFCQSTVCSVVNMCVGTNFHKSTSKHFATTSNAITTRKTELPSVGFYTKKASLSGLAITLQPLNLTVRKQKGGKKNPPIFNLFAQGVALPWKDGR